MNSTRSRPVLGPSLMDELGSIAIAAGDIALKYRRQAEILHKTDGSPVTQADHEANALVLERVGALLPHLSIVSEEQAGSHTLCGTTQEFLLVDPLDGTKEYIDGSDDFTVNIGWIRAGNPIAGVVYAPATRRLWLGWGGGATFIDLSHSPELATAPRQAIKTRKAPENGLIVLASRRHCNDETEQYLSRLRHYTRQSAGSSLKFCLLAEGKADLYPRMSPTMQWDTAAGDAILRAAGGLVTTLDGAPLTYGRRETGFNSPWFIAVGDTTLHI